MSKTNNSTGDPCGILLFIALHSDFSSFTTVHNSLLFLLRAKREMVTGNALFEEEDIDKHT